MAKKATQQKKQKQAITSKKNTAKKATTAVSTDLKIDALKDSIGLAIRKELQGFLSEMAKLLRSRPDDSPTEVPILRDEQSPDYPTPDHPGAGLPQNETGQPESAGESSGQHETSAPVTDVHPGKAAETVQSQLVDETVNEDELLKGGQSISLTDSKTLPSAERSQSSTVRDVEAKRADLVFGHFLERIHGGDEAKLNAAVEFWEKALGDQKVMRMLERCIVGPPARMASTYSQGGESVFDTVAVSKPVVQESALPSKAAVATELPTVNAEALGRRLKSGSDSTETSLAYRTATVLPPDLLEQGRQLSSAIAEMFGENPRLYSQGVPGDTTEVQLKLRRVVEQMKTRPELVVLLMRTVIPATLRRLTEESNLSPEVAVDIITLTIGDLRPKRQPAQQDLEMLQFFAAARALLIEQRNAGLSASERGGYYATRNAIAQYISTGRPSPTVLRVAVCYFEEVLFEYYQQMLKESTFRLTKRCRRSLEVAGNNCGNHLDDLRGGGADDTKINTLWAIILGITVAVAVEENRGEISDGELKTIRQCLAVCFIATTDGLDAGTMVAVDVMMYGPGAWRSEFGHDQMLRLMLSAGLIRLARPSRDEDAVSPLFNAGVELLRLGEQAGDSRRLAWQRLLVNAVGLWWSLKLNTDWNTALTKFHGLDCLVNLWGAICDVKAELQKEDGSFYRDCLALYHWTRVANQKTPERLADGERIRRSFEILKPVFDGEAQRSYSMTEALLVLENLCRHAIKSFAPETEIQSLVPFGSSRESREGSLQTTASYFGVLLASLRAGRPDGDLHFYELVAKVRRFVPEEGKTEQRILGLMKEIWGNLSLAENSVLVQTRIMDATSIRKLQEDTHAEQAANNYAFVENCEYSWLLI